MPELVPPENCLAEGGIGIKNLFGPKTWFTRQSINYFPLGDDGTLSISVGKDLKSKYRNIGWTIDMEFQFLFSEMMNPSVNFSRQSGLNTTFICKLLIEQSEGCHPLNNVFQLTIK